MRVGSQVFTGTKVGDIKWICTITASGHIGMLCREYYRSEIKAGHPLTLGLEECGVPTRSTGTYRLFRT
jgi:hypothetical protein